ncbi:MAG: FG-GAP-like repeat-containing protein, partial [Myxococcota bacterium]
AALAVSVPQRIDGALGERIGLDVAIVNDINNDGADDLIYYARKSVPSETPSTQGAIHIHYGVTDGTQVGPSPDVVIRDPDNSVSTSFGRRIAGVGDVNGDDFGDWLVYAPPSSGAVATTAPRAYLFFGTATESGEMLRRDRADGELELPLVDSVQLTQSVSITGLGDIDGDGLDDFALGVPYADVADDLGRLFVVRGRLDWDPVVVLSDAPAAGSGVSTIIPSLDDATSNCTTPCAPRLGIEMSSADVDGDGDLDLLANAGAPYAVVYINESGTFSALSRYTLSGTGDEFNRTGLGVGDLNGDGFADVALSTAAGVQLYLGDDRAGASDGTSNRSIPSISYDTGASGYLVGFSGSLDGDAFDDLAFTDRNNGIL